MFCFLCYTPNDLLKRLNMLIGSKLSWFSLWLYSSTKKLWLPYLKHVSFLHIYLLEASYMLLACKYKLMAPANRKQLLAAVFIGAAVLSVQKCTEKIMLINFLFPVNSYKQYSIYLSVKSRFCSNLFQKKLSANWSNIGTELPLWKCSWPIEELGDQCKGRFCWIARENSCKIGWGIRMCLCRTPPPLHPFKHPLCETNYTKTTLHS